MRATDRDDVGNIVAAKLEEKLRGERGFSIWMTVITFVAGIAGGFVVEHGYHYIDVNSHGPCVSEEGWNKPIPSYRYPPPAWNTPQSTEIDSAAGSNYAYVLGVHNSGKGPLLDASVRMNLPGVPTLMWTDHNETRVSAPEVTLLFTDPDGRIAPNAAPVSRNPGVFRPPELGLGFVAYMTPKTLPPPLPNATTFVPTAVSEWAKRIVYANGSSVIEYELPTLNPGDTWTIATLYWGHRGAEDAGAALSGARQGHDALWYNTYNLTALWPPPGHTITDPGNDVWQDAPTVDDCAFRAA